MNKIINADIKKRAWRWFFFLALGFGLLLGFRIAYGYMVTPLATYGSSDFMGGGDQVRRNYASKEYEVKGKSNNNTGNSTGSTKIDQKYEKIANINSLSNDYDSEEAKARQQIEQYKALIQFEQKSGNKGYRSLQLYIGVPPENFDALYEVLITIGEVQAKQITKKDKTNEYKELNARKISLETSRASLLELKTKSGAIDEFIQLDSRILDVEQQLQDLGVSLGDFDDANEFCTVQFSLREQKTTEISIMHRLKVAFEWTVRIYFRFAGGLFLALLSAYLLVLLIDMLKIIQRIMRL
jgi:hypothetical protein